LRCLKCRTDGIPVETVTCPRCGANLPALLYDVLPPGTPLRGTDYRIEYAIGRGGFGITYRAMHNVLDRHVAIKEFFPHEYAQRDTTAYSLSVPRDAHETYTRGLERFIKEGRILARLHHPNVVPVHDLFEERGTAYLIMELIEGHTLKDEMRRHPENRLPPDHVRGLMEQIVAALETVHRQDVYHLDIKPDNVLIGNNGRAILVDFGAARQGFSSLNTQAFTMDYAPPEIFAGADVSPASDIYETGILVHEMLTGARPPNALQRMHGQEWVPVNMEEPWRSLIASALRLKKEERPQSIQVWWETAFPPARPLQNIAQPDIPLPPRRGMSPVQTGAIAVAGVAALGLAAYAVQQQQKAKIVPTPQASVITTVSSAPVVPTPDPAIAKAVEEAKRIVADAQIKLTELKDQENRGSLTPEQARQGRSEVKDSLGEARTLAESVIQKDRKNKEAWLQTVSASYLMGDYTGTDQSLREAEKLFPGSSDFAPIRKMTDVRLKNQKR
jgi:serine/threonine protein kinase